MFYIFKQLRCWSSTHVLFHISWNYQVPLFSCSLFLYYRCSAKVGAISFPLFIFSVYTFRQILAQYFIASNCWTSQPVQLSRGECNKLGFHTDFNPMHNILNSKQTRRVASEQMHSLTCKKFKSFFASQNARSIKLVLFDTAKC